MLDREPMPDTYDCALDGGVKAFNSIGVNRKLGSLT